MKKNKPFIITVLILSIVIMSTIFALSSPTVENIYEISVIVPNSSNNMWNRFESGVREAMDNENVIVNIVNTTDMETLADQKNLIDKEIRNGTDGLIVEFIASNDTEKVVDDIVSKTNLLLLNTKCAMYDIDLKKVDTVTLDDELIATTLTSQLFDQVGRDLRFKRVGILANNVDQYNMKKRLNTVEDILDHAGAKIDWVVSGSSSEMEEQLKFVDIPNYVIGLNSVSLDSGIDFAKKYNIPLYGIGGSDQNVNALDEGIIQSMLVPDVFMMGYNSVQLMVQRIKFPHERKEKIIDFYTINKENMFSKQNESILFPIGD